MLAPDPASKVALVGISDQAVYSLTNIALAVAVANVSSSREFGAFTVFFIGYTLLSGVVDAFCGELFIVHHSGGGEKSGAQATRAAVSGLALTFGLVVGGACVVAFVVGESETARILGAFGLVLPFLLVQNSWRSILFSSGRARAALANDLVWAAVQMAAVVLVATVFTPTIPKLVLAWGSGAVVAAIFGAAQTKTVPNVVTSIGWARQYGRSGSAFGAEFLSLYGSSQAVFILVGAIAGLEALANVRVAQILFAPLSVVVNGARVALTPTAIGFRKKSVESFRVLIRNSVLGLGAIAGVWGVGVIAVPDRLWETLFDESWNGASELLLPFGISRVFLAAGFGAVIGMRAIAAVRASLVSRTLVAAISVVAGAAGALVSDASGAVWGLAIASSCGLPIMWRYFVNADSARPVSEPG